MNNNIANLLKHPQVWRLGDLKTKGQLSVPTGFPQLDRELPDNGWPLSCLIEMLCDDEGIGEISILLPSFTASHKQGKPTIVIAPKYFLYPLAWEAAGVDLKKIWIIEASGKDLLWAAEEALKAGCCGMVVIFAQHLRLDYTQLRRLQLTANQSNVLCMLYRTSHVKNIPSAAPLRLMMNANNGLLCIHIIKRRGALASRLISLKLYPDDWQIQQQYLVPDNKQQNVILVKSS